MIAKIFVCGIIQLTKRGDVLPEELNRGKIETKYQKVQEKIKSLYELQGFFVNPLWMPVIAHLFNNPEENTRYDITAGVKKIKEVKYVRVIGFTLNALKKRGYLEETYIGKFSLTAKGRNAAEFFMSYSPIRHKA